ncbi:type II toxin-antitoxin system PemK/MazF family toxin [Limosilactobacillus sp. pH52_RY]|uniref:type II toxin-antitoxin system PemK/MazF family toxin n=1 Tax=Limosilactobacillus balticus TaxID=2759747 RepID=UPI0015F87A39|nr:type II toxin-antitoxin system PemK/MazF family toxin [Limosilactobacillus balticus]MBB1110831.1 type II toxin-antitoxin system PemK/MazF family toxin [Limosilactobacillus balticus]
MGKNERIDKSANIFKSISEPDAHHYDQKFKYLPNWLDNTSYFYQKEANSNLPRRYYYYRRGTVIRVNFGTNLGSEFSNIHFAIVLDKKDSPKKKTLTVLPLTSKQCSNRFSLGQEVFNQTVTILDAQMKNLKDRINMIKRILDQGSKPSDEDYNSFLRDFEDLKKVVGTYKAYDKNSYVRLSDITTISKLRIERINKYDPSGKIRLSSQQMALISHELMKLYLSK